MRYPILPKCWNMLPIMTYPPNIEIPSKIWKYPPWQWVMRCPPNTRHVVIEPTKGHVILLPVEVTVWWSGGQLMKCWSVVEWPVRVIVGSVVSCFRSYGPCVVLQFTHWVPPVWCDTPRVPVTYFGDLSSIWTQHENT